VALRGLRACRWAYDLVTVCKRSAFKCHWRTHVMTKLHDDHHLTFRHDGLRENITRRSCLKMGRILTTLPRFLIVVARQQGRQMRCPHISSTSFALARKELQQSTRKNSSSFLYRLESRKHIQSILRFERRAQQYRVQAAPAITTPSGRLPRARPDQRCQRRSPRLRPP